MSHFKIEQIAAVLDQAEIAFTNSSLWMLFTLAVIWIFMWGGMKRSLIPGRWQLAVESVTGFIDNMLVTNIGPAGKKYVPYIFTIFIFILFANLLGLVPIGFTGAHPFTVTSHILVTGVMAVMSFSIVLAVGFWKHKLKFFTLFVPNGTPLPMVPLLFLIELVSFMVRPFSLALRLFIAMTAGHVLLKVFASFVISGARGPRSYPSIPSASRSSDMSVKIAINGFGRIGRNILRSALQEGLGDLDVVAINDLTDATTLAHLFSSDSVHGRFDGTVEVDGNDLVIDGERFTVLSERDPSRLPWSDLDVDIVFEATGLFRKRPDAQKHLDAGAKKVVVTAPAVDPDITMVLGVNDGDYDPSTHNIISNASCTTNCVAPVVKVLLDAFGFKNGLMTTVHSYTNDQSILDLPHKDLRRARAAAVSIIPTTTGAAKATGLVLPAVKGKIDGMAMRVPTPNVSIVDLVANVEKETNVEEVNAAMRSASEGALAGILGYEETPLVSVDYIGDPRSSIVDGLFTSVVDGNLVKVVSWYDNEWGYSSRCVALARRIGEHL